MEPHGADRLADDQNQPAPPGRLVQQGLGLLPGFDQALAIPILWERSSGIPMNDANVRCGGVAPRANRDPRTAVWAAGLACHFAATLRQRTVTL